MARENIIQHFSTCIDFIENALEDQNKSNGVLVHCFYGVSRSSTLVIAYLMKKYGMTYQKAFERAKSKRSLVYPNRGFVTQLKLWYKMNFKIDSQNKYYKVFRLKLAAENVKSAKILPSNFMDVIKIDPGVVQEFPEPYVYRCRKCNRIVASKSNLILHKTPKEDSSYDSPALRRKNKADTAQKYLNNLAGEVDQDQDAIIDITDKMLTVSLSDRSLSEIDKVVDTNTIHENSFCSKVYFIEPLSWMKDIMNNVEGKLNCPSCRTKIGSFNWIMASKCPCGVQVAPSFYLIPSKIDFKNYVQNLPQVTI